VKGASFLVGGPIFKAEIFEKINFTLICTQPLTGFKYFLFYAIIPDILHHFEQSQEEGICLR
jgi:hypothetical protein